jgi:hypothetical membrane protein
MGRPPERLPDSPLEGTEPRSVLGSRLVLAASLGPVLWIIGAVVSGLRRDEYSFRKQAISELGVGADAWLLNLSLVLSGVSLMVFAIGFYLLLPQLPRRRLASSLLMAFGACLVVLGVFPLAEGQEPTLSELLHFAIGFFAGTNIMAAALFVIGAGLKVDPQWESYRRYTLASAWIMALLVPLQFFVFNPRIAIGAARSGWPVRVDALPDLLGVALGNWTQAHPARSSRAARWGTGRRVTRLAGRCVVAVRRARGAHRSLGHVTCGVGWRTPVPAASRPSSGRRRRAPGPPPSPLCVG